MPQTFISIESIANGYLVYVSEHDEDGSQSEQVKFAVKDAHELLTALEVALLDDEADEVTDYDAEGYDS